jgi:hypothetical protein
MRWWDDPHRVARLRRCCRAALSGWASRFGCRCDRRNQWQDCLDCCIPRTDCFHDLQEHMGKKTTTMFEAPWIAKLITLGIQPVLTCCQQTSTSALPNLARSASKTTALASSWQSASASQSAHVSAADTACFKIVISHCVQNQGVNRPVAAPVRISRILLG